MDFETAIVWSVIFIISMVLATYCLRFWDNTRANIETRKIIGSTREEKNERIYLRLFCLGLVSISMKLSGS